MAIVLQYFEKNFARIIEAINQLTAGRSNATGTITVRTGFTTTVVNAKNCSIDSIVFLTPLDAGARAEYAPATTYVSNVAQGGFVLNHPNNGTTRTYGYLAIGG